MMCNAIQPFEQHRRSNREAAGALAPALSIRLLALLLIGLLIYAPAAQGEPITVPTLNGSRLEVYQDYHALVVGVEKYDHWQRQPAAVKNAREVSWALKKMGFSVTLLTNPPLEELAAALEIFARESGQEVERGLVFYFCGNSQSSTTLNGKKIGRLIPKDAPRPTPDRELFERQTITTTQIVDLAHRIQSKHVLFLFDAALSADAFQLDAPVLRIVNATSSLPTRQFITADNAHLPITERTVFKKYLLQGLKGEADLIRDGVVSGSELGIFMTDRIRNFSGDQRYPQFGTLAVTGDIQGDFIFQLKSGRPQVARLSVDSEPETAKIQILNIKPAFRQGMELKPDKYRIHVSAKGFETKTQWIYLKAGEDRVLQFELTEIKPETANSLGMKFIRIGKGSFNMGSPPAESGRANDETRHKVKLTESFFMQSTEITVKQFKKFVKSSGYTTDAEKGDGCWITDPHNNGWRKRAGTSWKKPGEMSIKDDYPAICVTWNDAAAFARWLSKKEKKNYRLPTEAEWEYAARAKTATPFSSGRCLSTKEANYGETGRLYQMCTTVFKKKHGRPIGVGRSKPNPWRLYNIHGNISEWCLDWYAPLPKGAAVNPKGPKSGSERVLKGGHWKADAAGSRSAARRRFPPNFASDAVGFRLVMVP